MKKWFISKIIILLIIVALVLILPYSMGRMTQNKYFNLVNSINKPGVQLKVISYDRGWFSSNANLSVTLQAANASAAGAKPLQFTIQQHISHGPVMLITDATNGEKHLVVGLAFINGKIDQPAINLHATTLVNFNGLLTSHITAPQIIYTSPQLSITVRNLTSVAEVSSDLNHIKGNVATQEMLISAADLQQDIKNIAIDYDLTKGQGGFYLGQRHLTIATSNWVNKTEPLLQMEGLDLNSTSNELNNKLDITVNFALAKITMGNESYGPHSLKFAVNDLDLPSLIALQQQLIDLQMTANPSQQQLQQYNQSLLTVLSKGLNIDLQSLSFATPLGVLQAKGNLTLPAQETPLLNPLALMADTQAHVNIQVPAALLEHELTLFYTKFGANSPSTPETNASANNTVNTVDQAMPVATHLAQQQISQWVKEGWLIADKENYKITLARQSGQFVINGKSFAPQQVAIPVNNVNIPVDTKTTPTTKHNP